MTQLSFHSVFGWFPEKIRISGKNGNSEGSPSNMNYKYPRTTSFCPMSKTLLVLSDTQP